MGIAAAGLNWPWLRTFAGALVAWLGAVGAQHMGMPLPWLLGPLLLIGGLRLAGAPASCWQPLRSGGQWVIGVSLGLYFTPEIIQVLQQQALVIAAGTLFCLVLGGLGAIVLRRSTGVDPATAWFGAAIGGASEMANLAERHGANVGLVATAHSLRILCVVLIVPFAFQALGVQGDQASAVALLPVDAGALLELVVVSVAGGLLFKRLGTPNPWVLGPLAVTVLMTLSGLVGSSLPSPVVQTGQLLIGWSLGDRYRPEMLKTMPRFALVVVSLALCGVALSLGLAILLSHVSALDLPTLILAVSPGGIAEMSITAKVLHLGVAVVTAAHVVRMIVVLLITGPSYSLWLKHRSRHSGASTTAAENGSDS